MPSLKHRVLKAGFRIGLFRLANRLNRHKALILTFHRFSGWEERFLRTCRTRRDGDTQAPKG